MFCKAGAIIPMIPEMSYIYEKAPDPITWDVYPDKTGPSGYTMYDCQTPKGGVSTMQVHCGQTQGNIEVAITQWDAAYELWVHYEKQPASVTADSRELTRLDDKSAYDAAAEGWYFGPGCFYGNEKLNTINIKIPKSSKPHNIVITK